MTTRVCPGRGQVFHRAGAALRASEGAFSCLTIRRPGIAMATVAPPRYSRLRAARRRSAYREQRGPASGGALLCPGVGRSCWIRRGSGQGRPAQPPSCPASRPQGPTPQARASCAPPPSGGDRVDRRPGRGAWCCAARTRSAQPAGAVSHQPRTAPPRCPQPPQRQPGPTQPVKGPRHGAGLRPPLTAPLPAPQVSGPPGRSCQRAIAGAAAPRTPRSGRGQAFHTAKCAARISNVGVHGFRMRVTGKPGFPQVWRCGFCPRPWHHHGSGRPGRLLPGFAHPTGRPGQRVGVRCRRRWAASSAATSRTLQRGDPSAAM
jgi:hypothetical protein